MLQLSSALSSKPVLSLQTGQSIARVTMPIFNPNNLKIEGFHCEDGSGVQLVLLCQDIRETIKKGFVVNDYEVLSEPDELVRLKDILEIGFELLGKQVVTISKDKVGKVSDYAVETESMFVQKLYVSQSLFKSFSGGNLSIDRSQINEITNKKIIINELMKEAKVPASATAV